MSGWNEQHRAGNPDPRPGAYYVSVLNGNRYALALGPYSTHQDALDAVEPVRRYCNQENTRAWFYGYGTCRLPLDVDHPAGKLNDAPALSHVAPKKVAA